MRVATLGPLYPLRGGIAHYHASLHCALVAAGHDVLSLGMRAQYPALLFPGVRQEDTSEAPLQVPQARVVHPLRPSTWVQALWRLARFRADLLVVQWWHPYFAPGFGAIARGARRLGIQVVFECHNVLPHEASPVDRALIRLALNSADRLVVHAEVERTRARALVGEMPVAVCGHPVYSTLQTSEGHPLAPSREPSFRLLFFGLLRAYKGVDTLVEAMAHVPEGVALEIVGEPYMDVRPLHARVGELGLSRRVRFVSRYVANEEIAGIMARADALVLPYRDATQSGVAQLGFAHGLPVIATRVGGLDEAIQHDRTGFLVPPGDPLALAKAIRHLYAGDTLTRWRAAVARGDGQVSWSDLVAALLTDRSP